jgi:uncharacterized protein
MGGLAAAGCPICGRDVSTAADNKSRPFCSPRCKLIDLDRWFSGSYRVPGPSVESGGMGESLGGDAEQSFDYKGDEDL